MVAIVRQCLALTFKHLHCVLWRYVWNSAFNFRVPHHLLPLQPIMGHGLVVFMDKIVRLRHTLTLELLRRLVRWLMRL